MLIDGRINKVLKFDDINSLISFKEWIKDNLTLYGEDQKIKDSHLETFLNYIQEETKRLHPEVKKDWREKIKELSERLKDGPKRNK